MNERVSVLAFNDVRIHGDMLASVPEYEPAEYCPSKVAMPMNEGRSLMPQQLSHRMPPLSHPREEIQRDLFVVAE